MKLKITIDGKPYEVEIEVDESESTPMPYAPATVAPAPLAPPPLAAPAASPNGSVSDDKVCRSPMVGIIVRINVQPGQQVQKDDAILVLEAMKMETTITSPITGKVKSVPVSASESVQSGQVLVEFE